MSKLGPIVIVEDDLDDQEMIQEAMEEVGIKNELVFFDRSLKAFEFLKSTTQQPFLILSDVNLPAQNGIEFKRQIDEDRQLREKSIPFVFYSTAVDKNSVNTAYQELTVQGFFKKEHSIVELEKTIHVIMEYWKRCAAPNNF